MKKIILSALGLITFLGASAQETYENANIATDDLNGTARYVGMGGALDALGADISVMGSNPAGIGLFRHSQGRVSFGFNTQQDAQSFGGNNKTNMSFDQAGVVISAPVSRKSIINFGFNYNKSRAFNEILSAADRLNGASLNKLSYVKGLNNCFAPNVKEGTITADNYTFSQVDYLNYNVLLSEEDASAPNGMRYFYNDADSYQYDQANKGYIGEYDFNISGNVNDRFYWGLTIGMKDVHYNGYSVYTEALLGADGSSVGPVDLVDERRISGQGFDIKAGVIFRPVEESPFRIGLSVATPTFYSLTTENSTQLLNKSKVGRYDNGNSSEAYDFKMNTPWKFGVSLGTTMLDCLALGASYEYADYGTTDSRIITDAGYDWWGEYTSNSSSDREMNGHTKETLRGVSTLKLGMEVKPDKMFAIRAGYNYVSPMYQTDGFKNSAIESPGSYYASNAAYTNWKETHRLTLGCGINVDKFTLDVAYQYQIKKGEFAPFMTYTDSQDHSYDNICNSVNVDNKRHQVIFTLGYSF